MLLRKSLLSLASVALCFGFLAAPSRTQAGTPGRTPAQDAPAPAKAAYNKVLGVVVSVSPDNSKMTVKPDQGTETDVPLSPETSYMRVPPGEKDLRKATRIELKDIEVGDRVYARSRQIEGQDHTPAVSVIVMSKADIVQHQQTAALEWQKRGSAGKVTAVDPAAKTVTISVQSATGPKDLVVATDPKTTFRRYSPDSVKFSDALASNFGEIAVGNNLRVLGDKNSDGTQIHAEQIVSGSFRNLAGTVTSIDPANNEIHLTDLTTKKPVTVKINADSNLRKLDPMMAGIIARMRANAAGTSTAGTVPASTPTPAGGTGGWQGGGSGGNGGPGGWQGGAGGPGGPGGGARSGDLSRMLERAPQFALADLKPGDAVVVTSSNGTDPARVTAITVVAGVEPILAAAPTTGRGSQSSAFNGGSWNLDVGGLPQ